MPEAAGETASDSAGYRHAQWGAHPAGQSSTPQWHQAYGTGASALTSPGQMQQSPGGLSPAHCYLNPAEELPWGAPPDAVGFQPWQIAQERIEAAVASTMTHLGQPDWAVSAR